MVETTWTEESTGGPKKRAIPTWAWFCGGGCLLAVLVAVVAVGLGFRWINEARDPEKQWPKLAEVLPYDEPRPKELELVMGMHVVGDQYTFNDTTRGFQLQIQSHRGSDGSQGRKDLFFSDPPKFPQNMGPMKFEDLASGTVDVQGRPLRIIRMKLKFAEALTKMMPAEVRDGMTSMAFVDLTKEGAEGMLMAQFTRMRGTDPVTDDEIRTILAPFHVGPDR